MSHVSVTIAHPYASTLTPGTEYWARCSFRSLLLQAAVLSGRHIVIQPVDCGSSWLIDTDDRDCSIPNTRSCWWNQHKWFRVRPQECNCQSSWFKHITVDPHCKTKRSLQPVSCISDLWSLAVADNTLHYMLLSPLPCTVSTSWWYGCWYSMCSVWSAAVRAALSSVPAGGWILSEVPGRLPELDEFLRPLLGQGEPLQTVPRAYTSAPASLIWCGIPYVCSGGAPGPIWHAPFHWTIRTIVFTPLLSSTWGSPRIFYILMPEEVISAVRTVVLRSEVQYTSLTQERNWQDRALEILLQTLFLRHERNSHWHFSVYSAHALHGLQAYDDEAAVWQQHCQCGAQGVKYTLAQQTRPCWPANAISCRRSAGLRSGPHRAAWRV